MEQRQDFTKPVNVTREDWHAILGYLLASIAEVRGDKKNHVRYYYPEGLREIRPYGAFNVNKYYRDNLKEICLSTGLQPSEFRFLFQSACIGQWDAEAFPGRHYDFSHPQEPHLTQVAVEKMLRHGGQANWADFKAHYGTTVVEDGNFMAWLEYQPTHDANAPFRYPAALTVGAADAHHARITMAHDIHAPMTLTFTVAITPKGDSGTAHHSLSFTAEIPTKELQNQMMNRRAMALEKSLDEGVDIAEQQVQAIAKEFGKPVNTGIPGSTVQSPIRQPGLTASGTKITRSAAGGK